MSSAIRRSTSGRNAAAAAALQRSPSPPLPSSPEAGRQTAAVKQIMAQCVATNSSNKYAGQISGFAMFRFDSTELRDHLLEPWFIEGLHELQTETKKKNYSGDEYIYKVRDKEIKIIPYTVSLSQLRMPRRLPRRFVMRVQNL